MTTSNNNSKYTVIAMYKFVSLSNCQAVQKALLAFCQQYNICGTILLAKEGINGTVAGSDGNIQKLISYLKTDPKFQDMQYKKSYSYQLPFYRMKVKIKQEIVTMGVSDINPALKTGQSTLPKQWNELLVDPNTVVIDTRNHYEYAIGTFKSAISPKTQTFREFPSFVKHSLKAKKEQNIALFCTGGIRCEKASTLLLDQGYQHVYQLEGGVLNYLRHIPPDESLWQGECFVFDNRVAVNHHLAEGQYHQCYACRMPLSAKDIQHFSYQEGVSCCYCVDQTSSAQRSRFQERQHQMTLAKKRNQQHIGPMLKR